MGYRIHAITLNTASLKALEREYKTVTDWKISTHCSFTLERRGISTATLFNVIDKGLIVEYHTMNETRRVLLKREDICVVLDLDTHDIITIFPSNKTGQQENQLFGGS